MFVTCSTWMLGLAAWLLIGPTAWATIPDTPLALDGVEISRDVAVPSEGADRDSSQDFARTTIGVPEPACAAMLASGLFAMVAMRRRLG